MESNKYIWRIWHTDSEKYLRSNLSDFWDSKEHATNAVRGFKASAKAIQYQYGHTYTGETLEIHKFLLTRVEE